jgi:hypothetical protein
MVHRHHIIPRYEGGGDEAENIVELTPKQHAMWHYAEWQRKQRWEDFCAFKMILGDVNSPELRSARAKWAGAKGAQALKELNPEHWNKIGKLGYEAQRKKFEIEGRTVAEKKWIVISPEGDEFEIVNMAKFCRERGLNKAHMCAVAAGARKQHKGWKAKKP